MGAASDKTTEKVGEKRAETQLEDYVWVTYVEDGRIFSRPVKPSGKMKLWLEAKRRQKQG